MNPVRPNACPSLDSRATQWDALQEALRDLQADVRQLFEEATELPFEGLRPTLVRRRDRVLERASTLLRQTARLMKRLELQGEADFHGRRREVGNHADWKEEWRRLRRQLDEQRESWRSIVNEDGDLVMESLVLDLGGGD